VTLVGATQYVRFAKHTICPAWMDPNRLTRIFPIGNSAQMCHPLARNPPDRECGFKLYGAVSKHPLTQQSVQAYPLCGVLFRVRVF